jgi:hypothetical protein
MKEVSSGKAAELRILERFKNWKHQVISEGRDKVPEKTNKQTKKHNTVKYMNFSDFSYFFFHPF